ncbi:hypothetical protein TNCV_2296591 [Trichonephila clavipes]|nr:hypothetical protein TNCV_2296591 [Trichonephila clavipes]
MTLFSMMTGKRDMNLVIEHGRVCLNLSKDSRRVLGRRRCGSRFNLTSSVERPTMRQPNIISNKFRVIGLSLPPLGSEGELWQIVDRNREPSLREPFDCFIPRHVASCIAVSGGHTTEL